VWAFQDPTNHISWMSVQKHPVIPGYIAKSEKATVIIVNNPTFFIGKIVIKY